MKVFNKILWTIVALFISVLLPAILSAFFYVHIPGLVLAWLSVWLLWFLIFLWKLKSPDDKHPEVKSNGNWGGSDNDTYGLKSELAKVIAPNNFMKPYDPEKVTEAIELYNRLKTTDADDLLGLKEIRTEAEQSLGISIDTAKFSRHLLEVFSPSKYKGKPEYVNEMTRICSDIARHSSDTGAMEDIVINAQKRIAHWNSLAPSYRQKMIYTFLWGVLGSAALWFAYAVIKQYIVFFN